MRISNGALDSYVCWLGTNCKVRVAESASKKYRLHVPVPVCYDMMSVSLGSPVASPLVEPIKKSA